MKKMSLSDLGGVVYSSEQGRMCPSCGKALAQCICKALAKTQVQGDGNVRVGRATAGRKGNGVTTITGLPLPEAELLELARKLKARCGCGGTVKDGVIEIQGEQRDVLVAELIKLGYKAKKSGS
jgi:translation initiation factor 1